MKFLKVVGKIILYALLVVLGIVILTAGAIWGYQKYKHHQLAKELEALPIDDTLSYEHILHDELDEKMGDNQMTVEEKLDHHLNPFETDTSGNGLSDDEAIKQGLDPTKFSTADDGISDYVKIEEGLDPTKKVNPNDMETFTIKEEDLGATLETNDLNAKYFSSIDAYEQKELETIYHPVRDPIRVRNYSGDAVIDVPGGKDKAVHAYYYNFKTDEMEKIKKQRWTDDGMKVNIDKNYPIYFIDDKVLKGLGDYYFFRISPYIFGPGYDHKVFIFKRGLFTDDVFKDEKIDDPDYGVVEISKAEVSYIYSLFLDGLFKALDTLFKPLDEAEGNLYTRIWLDYGKTEGSEEYAQHKVMPWLYEDEEIETENENSKKVVDSGFRLKHHTFRFGNMVTEVGDNGICAGISRTTEFIYNGKGIASKQQFKPEYWRSKASDKLNSGKYSALKYDISGNEDKYPFLEDGELFDYRFTDKKISKLTEDKYIDADLEINPGKLSEPDQSLVQLLETQWMISNDKKAQNKPRLPYSISVLEQVEDYLADGQIIYASLSNSSGGHTVSIYKMEYDKYDDDLIRLYVYDPNLPYQKLTEDFGTKEVYMEIHTKKEHLSDDKYFDFNYTPFEDLWSSYSFSKDNGYTLLLYHNDKPINRK